MAKRTYENDDIIVYWDSDLCIHVAECLKGNGEVFNLGILENNYGNYYLNNVLGFKVYQHSL